MSASRRAQMRHRMAGGVVFGACVLAGLCVAAALPTLAPISSVLAVDVTSAPYELQAGAGANRERFIDDFELSANRTSFTARIQAKAGGDMVVKDVFRVVSAAPDSRAVTLGGDGVSGSAVQTYTWTVKNETTTFATLDLKAGTPSAGFTLPSGASYQVDLRIKLAKGAGANDATVASAIWSVTG